MPPPASTTVVKAKGLDESPAEGTPISERKQYHDTFDARYYKQIDVGVYIRKTLLEEEDNERPAKMYSRSRRGSHSCESSRERGWEARSGVRHLRHLSREGSDFSTSRKPDTSRLVNPKNERQRPLEDRSPSPSNTPFLGLSRQQGTL